MTKITKSSIPAALGFFMTLICCAMIMILGSKAYVPIHDQLDGEVTNYILRARHPGADFFPEMMGGQFGTAITPPSYGTLLFYRVFEPATAFNLNYCFVQIIAYLGMYLLLTRITGNRLTAAIVSFLFGLLPFYSVYGLSVMGQPLLWYALIELWDKRTWKAYLIAGIFAAFSSPILIGFADCVLILVFMILSVKNRHRMNSYLMILVLIGAVYAVLYKDLIREVFDHHYISHRSESVLDSQNWFQAFFLMLRGEQQHAVSNHMIFLPWALGIAATGILFKQHLEIKAKKQLGILIALIGLAVLIAAFYATFNSPLVVNLREQAGGIVKSFQIDRIYWFYPGLWFLILGITAGLLAESGWKQSDGKWLVVRRRLSALLCAVMLGMVTYQSVIDSNIKRDAGNLIGKNNEPTFQSFYSPELFREINQFIKRPQNDYKVASIGLYPSVSLYNGFYCIDGYSNNYPLEYKHRFREVIAEELMKSETIRTYFDEWGNRCYLFTAETGTFSYYTKNNQLPIKHLQLNTQALKTLGCEYIFSGVSIENAEENGWNLLGIFENENSPYRICVYGL